jgi:hypothetical protein
LVIPAILVLEMFSIITMAARMIFRVLGIILQKKFIMMCVVVSKPLPNVTKPAARWSYFPGILCLLSRCRFIFHSSDIQVTRFVKYFVLQGWSVRNRWSLVIVVCPYAVPPIWKCSQGGCQNMGRVSILYFWVVTPCGLVCRSQPFGRTYCLHLLRWSVVTLCGVVCRYQRFGEASGMKCNTMWTYR